MKYKEWIDLGFKRHEMNDCVEMADSGYGGYSLGYEINQYLSIWVNYKELDAPRLYIRKYLKETNHIIPISVDAAKDLIDQNNNN